VLLQYSLRPKPTVMNKTVKDVHPIFHFIRNEGECHCFAVGLEEDVTVSGGGANYFLLILEVHEERNSVLPLKASSW